MVFLACRTRWQIWGHPPDKTAKFRAPSRSRYGRLKPFPIWCLQPISGNSDISIQIMNIYLSSNISYMIYYDKCSTEEPQTYFELISTPTARLLPDSPWTLSSHSFTDQKLDSPSILLSDISIIRQLYGP